MTNGDGRKAITATVKCVAALIAALRHSHNVAG